MRLSSLALVALAPIALATPVWAQSEEDILAKIEELHGLSEEFGEAFGQLQDAFLFDDPSGLASLGEYPLPVEANGEAYDLLEAQDLIDNFNALLTAETQAALASQDFDDLIVTSDGVGLADGAVWMNVVCADDACESGYWAITSINN
ncbi:hypothetical protein [Devosia submarina]|uniref:hypothetical protein n=1 Tax=Devosia submarina TaxID=1173082 RepID=UPI000D34E6EE|nr:hypothetical protein [Devosia submarina]